MTASGKNGNGRKQITTQGVFPDEESARLWAAEQYPNYNITLVTMLSLDCTSDEAGTVGTGSCFELVLQERSTENGLAPEIAGTIATFWSKCGFDRIVDSNGCDLATALVKACMRPVELVFLSKDGFRDAISRVFDLRGHNAVALYMALHRTNDEENERLP